MKPTNNQYQPLANRMRPKSLEEFFGQSHLLAKDASFRQALGKGILHSMILWGPPGNGKTTLAYLMADSVQANFIKLSAIFSGVKDLRSVVADAKIQREKNIRTVLFVDEIHRFNKSQQDAFLPFVEEGLITLIGATTENPSFTLNNALLSRARVYVLNPLSDAELHGILSNALDSANGLGDLQLDFPQDVRDLLVASADHDARNLLNLLENISDLAGYNGKVTKELLSQVLQKSLRQFDNKGDSFYEQISALHKSARGSDPDAALYWLCRMFDGGCDPLYIARRVIRMASEDIGNADPRALQLAINANDAYERLGSPEGELAISQAVLYMAAAPKSNAVYIAFNQAMKDVKSSKSLPVPMHLRNAPTKLLKELGCGAEYRYAHDEPNAYATGVKYFPDKMSVKKYYYPVDRGLEIKIAEKLAYLRKLSEKTD